MPDHRSQIGAVTGRHLRRRRTAAKSSAPRRRAAGARKRPCVGPPVADRSSGRLGTVRLTGALGEPSDTRGRSNASFAFPALRARGSSRERTTIERRRERAEESKSTHTPVGHARDGPFGPRDPAEVRSRSEETERNERAGVGRPFELALDVRADERFFFPHFKYAHSVLYTNTALPRVGVERPNGPYVART